MIKETDNGNGGEAKWTAFVDAAFKAANLPDVPEDQLETGTYTNRQIADRFRSDPLELMGLLMGLPEGNIAARRSMLSFAVEILAERRNGKEKIIIT